MKLIKVIILLGIMFTSIMRRSSTAKPQQSDGNQYLIFMLQMLMEAEVKRDQLKCRLQLLCSDQARAHDSLQTNTLFLHKDMVFLHDMLLLFIFMLQGG